MQLMNHWGLMKLLLSPFILLSLLFSNFDVTPKSTHQQSNQCYAGNATSMQALHNSFSGDKNIDYNFSTYFYRGTQGPIDKTGINREMAFFWQAKLINEGKLANARVKIITQLITPCITTSAKKKRSYYNTLLAHELEHLANLTTNINQFLEERGERLKDKQQFDEDSLLRKYLDRVKKLDEELDARSNHGLANQQLSYFLPAQVETS